MPRVKASPKKCVKSNSQSNTWVFLVKGEALEIPEGWAGTTTPDVVQLRHPQSGAPALFLFSPSDTIVQEVLTFSENQRSWLIEEGTKSDGKLQLSTPVDPLFLVLPYLRKLPHAAPLDQIIKDDEFPETERLLSSAGLKHIGQVADKKSEELNAYVYNEEKALSWLQKKTERVADVLKEKGIHCSGGAAISSTFVKSSKSSESPEAYLKYAHGVISEYLADDLSAKLSRRLGVVTSSDSTAHAHNKRKQLLSPNGENKRTKVTTDDLERPPNNSVLDLSKPVPAKSQTSISSKEKARAKAAAGSKNISSFFKKK